MSHLRIIRVIESDLYFRNIRYVALWRLNREDARIISVRLLEGYWCSHVKDDEEKGLELGMVVKMRALCFYLHNALCQRLLILYTTAIARKKIQIGLSVNKSSGKLLFPVRFRKKKYKYNLDMCHNILTKKESLFLAVS